MPQTVYYALDKLEPSKANYVDRLNALLEVLGGGLGDYTGQLSLAGLSGNVTLSADLARRPVVRLTGNPAAAVTLKIPLTGRAIIHVINQCSGSFPTVTVKSVGANTSNAAGVLLSTGQAQSVRHDGNSAYAVGAVAPTAPTSWTPTWTNVTVGNGTVTASYQQVGNLVVCRVSLVFGSTTSLAGDIQISLPVTAITYGASAGMTPLGNARAQDISAATVYEGAVINVTTTRVGIRFALASGTYLTQQIASATVPFTWATGDEVGALFIYEAA